MHRHGLQPAPTSARFPRFIVSLALLMAFCFLANGAAWGQAAPPLIAPPAAPASAAKDAPAAPPEVQGIAVADIAVQAEEALLRVRQLENRTDAAGLIETVKTDIPALSRAIMIRTSEMRRVLLQKTSLSAIRDLEAEWRDLETRTSGITEELTQVALRLDADLAALDKLDAQWNATKDAAVKEEAPEAIIKRIGEVTAAIAKAKKRMLERRADILSLQAEAANLSARSAQTRQTLREASERAAAQLMHRDSPPVWSSAFWAAWIGDVSVEESADLPSHASVLASYLQYQQRGLILHALFFAALVFAFYIARNRMRLQRAEDSCFRQVTVLFDMPVVTALLIALLASTWFYPRPPRTLWIIINIIGVVPVLMLARRMSASYLHPVLYALGCFYLADKLRALIAVLPVLARVMLFVELVLFLAFVLWSIQLLKQAMQNQTDRLPGQRTVRLAAWLTGALTLAALSANLNGQVRLSGLLGGAVILVSYMAVVIYTLMRVSEGLIQAAMCAPPISYLGMVQRKKDIVISHFRSWLRWAAYAVWIALALQTLALMQPAIDFVKAAWETTADIGTYAPTVGDIVTFILIIWGTLGLSRLTRFVLEEEFYPKLELERGLPYAISTMVHYVVLLTGFVLALNALQVDMTKFTILAGALSVGIGFGLQNIVNNFVSGLIVLFERPVKVGDTIQMDDVVGRVKRIGIRASVISSTSGAEVIIPNGKLISERVTNWTLSSKLRQVMVPAVTKAAYDAGEIKQLLLDIAARNSMVVDKPAPEALFVKRTIDQAEFELHVWTAELDEWLTVRSDLMSEINEALRNKDAASATGG